MFQFIKRWLLPFERQHREKKATLYVFLLLLLGIVFMIMSHLSAKNEQAVFEQVDKQAEPTFGQKQEAKSKIIADYEERYEEQLKTALEAIEGVDDVTVVVNVDATETKVLEKNRVNQQQTTDETDREGGKRKIENNSSNEQVVIVRDGEKETPIVLTTKKPEIRGVLVVAKGADNLQVKQWIVEAVTRVLHVPSYRVAVLPKK
ncbi:stage III sporulation protein AG [Thermaerobacillus caldiproteolyticus]|uniref:Stage III sporulation protein AG n=1 Tax=Thermaerobacillus caldiproteolyticus TaxID=247480 RepID=A0A7V9Z3K3_9BACL|nr:stage III sporulation protein AG [Anoxybacillus caldiproteolyticus]MBA2873423.1 stage III sporulation protein AG [Anoxybacillus caldiproteolyticus]